MKLHILLLTISVIGSGYAGSYSSDKFPINKQTPISSVDTNPTNAGTTAENPKYTIFPYSYSDEPSVPTQPVKVNPFINQQDKTNTYRQDDLYMYEKPAEIRPMRPLYTQAENPNMTLPEDK